MDTFEKVEKLVQKTGVSFEEAKDALERADGDLLDAMILLEREGKASAPKQSTYSTHYEEQPKYVSVSEQVENARREKEMGTGETLKNIFGKVWSFLKDNKLVIRKKGEEPFARIPLLFVVPLLIFFWWIIVVLFVASLFCGYRYSFVGHKKLEKANSVMEKAGNAAEKVKEEFTEKK